MYTFLNAVVAIFACVASWVLRLPGELVLMTLCWLSRALFGCTAVQRFFWAELVSIVLHFAVYARGPFTLTSSFPMHRKTLERVK